jgi:hypothetical protein
MDSGWVPAIGPRTGIGGYGLCSLEWLCECGNTGATEGALYEAGPAAATLPLPPNSWIRKRAVRPITQPDVLARSTPGATGHLVLIKEQGGNCASRRALGEGIARITVAHECLSVVE